MRYPTDGLLNFFPGQRALCQAAIAFPYSLASCFSVSKSALFARACKKASFFWRAVSANCSISFLLASSLAYNPQRGKAGGASPTAPLSELSE